MGQAGCLSCILGEFGVWTSSQGGKFANTGRTVEFLTILNTKVALHGEYSVAAMPSYVEKWGKVYTYIEYAAQ